MNKRASDTSLQFRVPILGTYSARHIEGDVPTLIDLEKDKL